jgi:hypothetical protein
MPVATLETFLMKRAKEQSSFGNLAKPAIVLFRSSRPLPRPIGFYYQARYDGRRGIAGLNIRLALLFLLSEYYRAQQQTPITASFVVHQVQSRTRKSPK